MKLSRPLVLQALLLVSVFLAAPDDSVRVSARPPQTVFSDSFATRVIPAAAPNMFDDGAERFGVLWSGMRRSDDGGKTWSWVVPVSSEPFGQPFYDFTSRVFLIQRDVGLLGGGRDTWKTTDGGKTWTRLFGESFGGIAFADSMNGWLALPMGENYISHDGGNTWQSCGKGLTADRAQFVTGTLGWGIGTTDDGPEGQLPPVHDRIFRTTDGGCSWQLVARFADAEYKTIQFLDDKEGWIAADALGFTTDILRHTRDGGQTWETLPVENRRSILSLYFADAQRGWLALDNGFVATHDGGHTWARLTNDQARAELPAAWAEGRFHLAIREYNARQSQQSARMNLNCSFCTDAQLDNAATHKVLPQNVEGFPFPWDKGRLNYCDALVEVTVDANGNVLEAVAANQTYPEAMQNAIAAVKQWKFDPSRLNLGTRSTIVGQLDFLFRTNGIVEEAKPIKK